MTNPSQVPIDFQVKMSKINYSEMLFDGKKEKKQDFSYYPTEGVVAPYACVAVEVIIIWCDLKRSFSKMGHQKNR